MYMLIWHTVLLSYIANPTIKKFSYQENVLLLYFPILFLCNRFIKKDLFGKLLLAAALKDGRLERK